jgi:hemerythrin
MGTYITWKPYYSVNCPPLDDEHRQVIACINELHSAMNGADAAATIKRVMDKLVGYTRTHFEHEEQILKEIGHPDFAAHKALHDAMKRRTLALRGHLDLITARDVLVLLKDWWLGHIQSEDKSYTPYLQPAAVD